VYTDRTVIHTVGPNSCTVQTQCCAVPNIEYWFR